MKEWPRQREECFRSHMTHRASIHFFSVLNSSKVGNIFWKAMEHFAQMKLHPLALNTDRQKQSSRLRHGPGAQPPAKLLWGPADRPREPSPWPQPGFKAAAHLHSILPTLSATLSNHAGRSTWHLWACLLEQPKALKGKRASHPLCPPHLQAPCLSHSRCAVCWGHLVGIAHGGPRQEPHGSITLSERRMWSRDFLWHSLKCLHMCSLIWSLQKPWELGRK